MKKLVQAVAMAALLATQAPAQAAGVGVAQTYSKLVWSITTTATAFANCTQLVFDATGDLINSDNLILAGAMNCGAAGYAIIGAGYTGRDGSVSITFTHGGFTTFCPRLLSFVGSCTTFDWAGNQRGVGTIRLL